MFRNFKVGVLVRGDFAFLRRTSNAERRTCESSAFTLIELLTVIAIIVLLAGMVMNLSSYFNRLAAESAIRSELKAMEGALEAYKADYGTYPGIFTNNFASSGAPSATNSTEVNNPWLNSAKIYNALCSSNVPKIYMNFASRQLKSVTNAGTPFTVILDPLGNPYGYNSVNPNANPSTFDLWSAGIDGLSVYPNLSSTNDDIGNWNR